MPDEVSISTAEAGRADAFDPGVSLQAAEYPIETADQTAFAREGRAWLRDYNTATELGRFEQSADLPVVGVRPDDWASGNPGESDRGRSHKQWRWDGAAWVESAVYARGPAATQRTGFRWEWGEPPFVAELDDGTTQKFYLKDDGSMHLAGTLTVGGNVILTGTGQFQTSPAGVKRVEMGATKDGVYFREPDPSVGIIQVFSAIDATTEQMRFEALVGGSTPNLQFLFGNAFEIIKVGSDRSYMRLTEVAAVPPIPGAGKVAVYAKNNSLWIKDEADVETDLASGSTALIVQEGDTTVEAVATVLDFGAGFDVTSSPAGEANIGLDLSEVALPVHDMALVATVPNVAGSLTALQMGIGNVLATVVLPWNGSLVGLSLAMSEARTMGTCTVEVYLDGVATGLTAVIDGTNTLYKATTQAAGTDTFTAGQRIDLRLTSTATWLPITSDAYAVIWVEYTS